MLFPLRDFHPTSSLPIVTYTIIAINIIVFIYQYVILGSSQSPEMFIYGNELVRSQAQYFLFQYSVTPCEIFGLCNPVPTSGPPVLLTLFTSIFLHGSILHLLGNMWYLWVFGDNIEAAMGRLRYILFYLVGGLAATFAQLVIAPDSFIPMVGASGAIAAVLGGYLVLYPKARVLTLFFFVIFVQLVRLPAAFLLGFWFLLQVLSSLMGVGSQIGGGVAYMAHIGGFIAGALLIRYFARDQREYGWD